MSKDRDTWKNHDKHSKFDENCSSCVTAKRIAGIAERVKQETIKNRK